MSDLITWLQSPAAAFCFSAIVIIALVLMWAFFPYIKHRIEEDERMNEEIERQNISKVAGRGK